MAKIEDVSIYMRYIKLDVVIPEEYAFAFMKAFGNAFEDNDIEDGRKIRAVDNYYNHPGGWHIQVAVWENDEDCFYDFLRSFCELNKLTFRDPRVKINLQTGL